MNNLVFDWSALGNMALGAIFLYAGKLGWQRYGNKSNRISEDLCGKNQAACREKLLTQWYDYKLAMSKEVTAQNSKFILGDENFINLGLRQDRTNALLKALLSVELERCRVSKEIDCDELTAILVEQNIEVGSLGFKKRKAG